MGTEATILRDPLFKERNCTLVNSFKTHQADGTEATNSRSLSAKRNCTINVTFVSSTVCVFQIKSTLLGGLIHWPISLASSTNVNNGKAHNIISKYLNNRKKLVQN